MNYLRELFLTALQPFTGRGWVLFFLYSFVLFMVMFILSELAFLYRILTSTMPFSLIVDLFISFIKGDAVSPRNHYLAIALLGGMYINTLHYLFLHKHYFSKNSFITSMLGAVGISIGLSCISCGVAAVILLFSFLGISSSLAILSIAQPYALFTGEAILVFSIFLAVISLKQLR